jgi:hypothetical protein
LSGLRVATRTTQRWSSCAAGFKVEIVPKEPGFSTQLPSFARLGRRAACPYTSGYTSLVFESGSSRTRLPVAAKTAL